MKKELEIPELTKDLPYIEFRFDKAGKMTLAAHPKMSWGGINGGFFSTGGYHGNVCDKPAKLKEYINRYVDNKVKKKEKEIKDLQGEIQNLQKLLI
jgi:hypothetical protein